MAGLPVFGSNVVVNGSGLGNALSEIFDAGDIIPGDLPSYEACKTIWLYHPLGKKMVEGPVAKAQSQARKISVPKSPEEKVRDKFLEQWEADGADRAIYATASIARAYGIATLAIQIDKVDPDKPLDPKMLAQQKIAYTSYDPLNTAGSLVLDQDPLSIDFMKVTTVAVNGRRFHRSRTVTLMHEQPVYISYTSSAFGFVGRSVFQRALFPLKSFIQTMVTDDLVSKKAGVFIAKLKAAGAIIDKIMQASAAIKRLFVKEATNGNVISIGTDEEIETLNMQNIDKALTVARQDILENIATAADMPAILLKQETFAEGFGEGTEDAKLVADYIDGIRKWLGPLYTFVDPIVQRRAWTVEFFKSVQEEFPEEYGRMEYDEAFYRWQNSFKAEWPNLLKEPDSEKVKADDVKLKAAIAWIEVLLPNLDPENKASAIEWACATINENKMMFQNPLLLDIEALANYEPPAPSPEPGQNKPFAANDSVHRARVRKRIDQYTEAKDDLLSIMDHGRQRALPSPRPNGKLHPDA